MRTSAKLAAAWCIVLMTAAQLHGAETQRYGALTKVVEPQTLSAAPQSPVRGAQPASAVKGGAGPVDIESNEGTMSDDVTYSLEGRVMDISDNWLPGVRVALKRAGVVTHTDGNGLFSLRLRRSEPPAADKNGVYEVLELDKDGYQGRNVEIKDLTFFDEPKALKLEPNPVGQDTVGFSARMSMGYFIRNWGQTLRAGKPPGPIDEDAFKRLMSRAKDRTGGGRTERVWFHAYVPEGVEKLKAAFLISRHGMGTIDHPVLRRFADDNDLALVGVFGAPVQYGCYPLRAMDEYLERLGEMAGHPELVTVPVFAFGHSNGTSFATVWASERPDRVIGWISYHSGWSWHLQFPGVEKVPGLVMHGHKDQWFEHGQEETVKHLRSRRNAPVAIMIEANVGHGPVDPAATWEFIVDFCKATMRIRLGRDGALRPVVMEKGWLGGHYDRAEGGQQTLRIAPYDEYGGDRSAANWLPDATFARIWQIYGKTDPRSPRP